MLVEDLPTSRPDGPRRVAARAMARTATLPLGWADMSAELVAAVLEEQAAEFEREADRGGHTAAGLSLAARVLRDRAVEVLTTHDSD